MVLQNEVDLNQGLSKKINGIRRSQISIPLNTPNCDIEEMVMSDEVIMRAIDGLVIKKIIIVPNRIINIVAS